LVAGSVFGTGFLIASWLINRNDAKEGHMLSTGLGLGLGAGMGYRAFKTNKAPMPTAVAVAGLAMAGYSGFKAWQWR